jgi:hypothetical protein
MLANSDKDQTKACLSSIFNLPLSLLFISVADPFPNLDPDPHVSGPPGSGSISMVWIRILLSPFYHQAKIVRKTLIPNRFVTSFGLFIFEK